MEVKIIEAKNNEIRLVEDILLIYVKDINLLRNMNKEQLVEFMFNENEIVKSLSFVREFKDSIRNCVFDIISVNVKDIIKKIYGYSCNDEELMSGVFVLNELENLFGFAEIDIFNEHDDRLSSIMENYSNLVKKYDQNELSSTIFFKLLYRVRRIEFNNAAVSDIDLYDLISTVVSRELSIKRLEYDKDTSPIEKLLGLFMVEDDVKEIISKNIKSLEREITPNGVGIERDTTNIKLIKTLKKINEIK